jgi:MPBQ/MSBQ methyltransferase
LGLDWLYRLDELKVYSVNTERGRERLESFTQHLPDLLNSAGVSLPKTPRVLCLFGGSCAEGIGYAQAFHADVTCLYFQQRMLAIGRSEARRRGLNVRTVKSDAREVAKATKGPFDLVTIHGSPLPHVDINDFDQTVAGVKKVLGDKGTFLIEQSDLIFRVLPQYRDAFVSNLEPVVVNIHRGFNPAKGFFERLYYSGTRKELFKVYLWSPWIIEYVLKKNGFSKVKVQPYADTTTMAQTYLIAATR